MKAFCYLPKRRDALKLMKRKLHEKKCLTSRKMAVEGSQYESKEKLTWQLPEFGKGEENLAESHKSQNIK